MSAKKTGKLGILLFSALAVVVIGGIGYLVSQQNAPAPANAEEVAGIQPAASDTEEPEDSYIATVTDFPGNTAGPTGERTIGDPEAPVKITEYSSLTCGHCGKFHQDTLGELKQKYVDTGKLFIRFIDFPLNKPALDASMVARCLPHDRYYSFLQLLFKTQDKWAYESNYISYLKQNAQLVGLNEESFQSCVDNEELREFILGRMKEGQQENNIKSTPTFVFDNGMAINGNQPFSQFARVIDARLAAPETEEEAAEAE